MTYSTPVGHGNPTRSVPDVFTDHIPHTTPTERRKAAIHAADAVLMAGGTADDLAAYLIILFTAEELEEMGS